jgi:DNA primase
LTLVNCALLGLSRRFGRGLGLVPFSKESGGEGAQLTSTLRPTQKPRLAMPEFRSK